MQQKRNYTTQKKKQQQCKTKKQEIKSLVNQWESGLHIVEQKPKVSELMIVKLSERLASTIYDVIGSIMSMNLANNVNIAIKKYLKIFKYHNTMFQVILSTLNSFSTMHPCNTEFYHRREPLYSPLLFFEAIFHFTMCIIISSSIHCGVSSITYSCYKHKNKSKISFKWYKYYRKHKREYYIKSRLELLTIFTLRGIIAKW